VIIQACSNVNNMFINIVNSSQNPNKKIVEKTNYNKNVNIITQTKLEIDKKNKIKHLKELADTKMKFKINTVEQIDSLILNGKI
jgi:hypothetical protein